MPTSSSSTSFVIPTRPIPSNHFWYAIERFEDVDASRTSVRGSLIGSIAHNSVQRQMLPIRNTYEHTNFEHDIGIPHQAASRNHRRVGVAASNGSSMRQ